MFDKFNTWGPATTLLVGLALIIVGAGAVVTIVNSDTYSFGRYLDDLQKFAYAIAGLAVGRGLMKAGESRVQAEALRSMSNTGDPADTHSHSHAEQH